jgi:hypothetical protein
VIRRASGVSIGREAGEQARAAGRHHEAAETVTLPTGGGMVIVSPHVLKNVSLENVMLHELGHVLGLNHDPRSRLMSTEYVLDKQGCVDKVTVETLAKLKNIEVGELNWCVLPPH